MSVTAPKISQFRHRLRSSFATTPTSAILPQVQTPTAPASEPPITALPTQPLDQLPTSQPVVTEPAVQPLVEETVAAEIATSTQLQPISPTEMSVESRLDVLDTILSRLEAAAPVPEEVVAVQEEVVAQPNQAALPPAQSIPQVATPLGSPVASIATDSPVPAAPPVYVSSISKESQPGMTAESPVVEAGGGIQVVEYEPSSELPVEVESFIEEIQDHQTEQPQEIVIADGQMQIQPASVPKKSVIVLPITPATEDAGERKNPKWSIRWLVEWSRKLMKAFSGKIIYREVSAEN